MEQPTHKATSFVSWLIIVLILAIIVGKGLFSFLVVGDLGQPTWDYRPVKDVPAESPYAIYELVPHPQHVKGAEGE